MRSFPAVLLLAASLCGAAELSVDVRTDRPDAVYRSGEEITVTARALEDGRPVSGLRVDYELIADGGFSKKGKFTSDAEKPFVWKHTFKYPGALRAEFTVCDRNGKKVRLKNGYDQVRFAGGRIGAVADPEKIRPSVAAPEDFADFWKKELAELEKEPCRELERREVENLSASAKKAVRLFDIRATGACGQPVSGYLAMPREAKARSLPAVLLLQGGGVHSARIHTVVPWARRGAICLEINAHGLPNGEKPEFYSALRAGRLKHYAEKQLWYSREEHYFRGIALRVVRALEYLRSLPEWNGRDLVVRGASQGGWQAVVGAALDHKVTLCIAGVPAYGDFDAEFSPELRRMPRIHWGGRIRALKCDMAKKRELLKVQSYFDPVHFAPYVGCETFMTVGYVDLSCPTTSVYSIYNSLPPTVKKHIDAFPGGVHAKCPTTAGDAALAAVIEKAKKR